MFQHVQQILVNFWLNYLATEVSKQEIVTWEQYLPAFSKL